MNVKYMLFCMLLCVYAKTVVAQSVAIPPGGTLVSEVDLTKNFIIEGQEFGDISIEDVEGQPFKKALIATTLVQPQFPNEFQLQIPNNKPVEKGDILLLTFFAKTDLSAQITGEGAFTCTFEQAKPPHDKSLVYETRINSAWKRFYIPFTVPNSFGVQEARLNFQLGYPQQIMQLADIKVINYHNKLSIKDLPVNKVSYAGRELEASWRKSAEERIEKHRKGDIEIKIVDASGKPVKNARVQLAMQKHLFGFGSNIESLVAISDKTYQQKALYLFNEVSLESDLEKNKWRDQVVKENTKSAIELFSKSQIAVSGHNLLWTSQGFYPEWLQNLHQTTTLTEDAARHTSSDSQLDILKNDMAEKTRLFHGKLNEWELVNDLYDNPDGKSIAEKNILADLSQVAKNVSPQTHLLISNYGILDNGGSDEERQLHTFKSLKAMLDKGTPIDGISIACHFKHNPTSPEVLIKLLDYYASLGKSIKITEFDMASRDEKLQADYTRDFYTAVFSHPAVKGISMWGFWEGQHPRPMSAMYKQDWSPKPNGQAWEELVLNQWKTKADGKTNEAGKLTTRGFLGEYTYEVKVNGKTIKGTFKALSNEKMNTLTIEI